VHIAKLLHRAGLAPSATEGRRLVQQGSVKIDGRKLEAGEQSVALKAGAVIQVGSRRYVEVVAE
jgi:tyrosyl-tRNA synthetase